MKNYIDTEMVESIQVIFENCEVIYIPSEFIHKLDVRGVRKDKYLRGFDGDFDVEDMTVSMYVDLTVSEYGDTAEIREKGMLFSSKEEPYDGYGRLYRSQDITSIEYWYKDGSMEQIYVDYTDGESNGNQRNIPIMSREVPRGLQVIIASPKQLQKYSPMQEVVGEVIGSDEEGVVEETPNVGIVCTLNMNDVESYSGMFSEMLEDHDPEVNVQG